MSIKQILYALFLVGLSIALVLVINWFLEGLLAFLVPGTTLTPDGDDLLSLGIRVLFLIIDIITIIAVFKWLRR